MQVPFILFSSLSMVSAITTSSADAALATSIEEKFESESDDFKAYKSSSQISYTSDGLSLTLAKRFDNPSIVSDFYIMFGRVEATIKIAPGTGIVSTLYLQSDDLDEIDIEWLGGDDTQVQSNFFSKGDTTTYDRGAFHSVNQPADNFYTYAIDWTEERVEWIVNGDVVRTLLNTSSDGYPQTPSKLYLGVWAGGDPSNEAGTIEWAGGETDYSQAPFTLHCSDLKVTDYSTGSEYKYGDDTGSWTSIKSVGGSVLGNSDSSDSASSSSGSSSSTSSKSSSSTSSSKSSTTSSFKSSSSSISSSNVKSSSSNVSSSSQPSASSSSTTESSTMDFLTTVDSSSTKSSTNTASSSSSSSSSTSSSSSASTSYTTSFGLLAILVFFSVSIALLS